MKNLKWKRKRLENYIPWALVTNAKWGVFFCPFQDKTRKLATANVPVWAQVPLGHFYPLASEVHVLNSSPFPRHHNKRHVLWNDTHHGSTPCQWHGSVISQASGGNPYLHVECTCRGPNTEVHGQTRKYTFAEIAEKTKQQLQLGLKRSTQKSLETARRMHHS